MSEKLHTIDLQLTDTDEALALFGTNDKNLKQIEELLNVSIVTRGEYIGVSGSKVNKDFVEEILLAFLSVIRKGIKISERDVIYGIELVKAGKMSQFTTLFEDTITTNAKGKSIRVKTLGQKEYVSAMKKTDLVLSIGPAGTGKTYLAVVMAVHALKKGLVKRIILTRQSSS